MITELQLELGPNSIISHILDDKIQNNTRINLIMSNYISDVGHTRRHSVWTWKIITPLKHLLRKFSLTQWGPGRQSVQKTSPLKSS